MIGLIGAMDEEIIILRAEMKNCVKEKKGGFEFIVGTLCGKEVVLLRCGIGKVQSAVGCAVLIQTFNPSCIINTGCAGGVNSTDSSVKLHFGDAVIASSLVYHDFDVTAFGYKRGQVPGCDSEFFQADKTLADKIEKAVVDAREAGKLPAEFKAVKGVIASGDRFVSDSGLVSGLKKEFPGLRAVDMESAAIAHCCAIFGTPFVALRCLSDIAGEESPVAFNEYLPLAARNSSEIIKKFVTQR